MESGHLPACFLAILGPFDPSMEALVCLTRLQEYRVEECLILVSLASAQGRQSVQTNIDAYCGCPLLRRFIRQFYGNTLLRKYQ